MGRDVSRENDAPQRSDNDVAPRRVVPTRITSIVRGVLDSRKLTNGVHQARIFQAFIFVCGEAVRKHVRPVALKFGELHVAVDSASWRQQLQFLSEDLRKKANVKLGKDYITSIRLTHGQGGALLFEEEKPPPPPVTLTATSEDLARADELSRNVKDGELATLIAHAFLSAKKSGRI